jgi:hypothetical protein
MKLDAIFCFNKRYWYFLSALFSRHRAVESKRFRAWFRRKRFGKFVHPPVGGETVKLSCETLLSGEMFLLIGQRAHDVCSLFDDATASVNRLRFRKQSYAAFHADTECEAGYNITEPVCQQDDACRNQDRTHATKHVAVTRRE